MSSHPVIGCWRQQVLWQRRAQEAWHFREDHPPQAGAGAQRWGASRKVFWRKFSVLLFTLLPFGASQALVVKKKKKICLPMQEIQEIWVQSLGQKIASLGVGNGNPLQYSSLDNPMDRGAWWATVHGITKNQTWLSNWALLPYMVWGLAEWFTVVKMWKPPKCPLVNEWIKKMWCMH